MRFNLLGVEFTTLLPVYLSITNSFLYLFHLFFFFAPIDIFCLQYVKWIVRRQTINKKWTFYCLFVESPLLLEISFYVFSSRIIGSFGCWTQATSFIQFMFFICLCRSMFSYWHSFHPTLIAFQCWHFIEFYFCCFRHHRRYPFHWRRTHNVCAFFLCFALFGYMYVWFASVKQRNCLFDYRFCWIYYLFCFVDKWTWARNNEPPLWMSNYSKRFDCSSKLW